MEFALEMPGYVVAISAIILYNGIGHWGSVLGAGARQIPLGGGGHQRGDIFNDGIFIYNGTATN